MLRVAIWDDREQELDALCSKVEASLAIEGRWELVRCSPSDISAWVGKVESVVADLRFDSEDGQLNKVSGIDVLCIDYDLRTLEDHLWLTADSLAGFVRAFTNCPCVVVLNRPPRSAFDLTMLSGWEGPADLQVPQAVVALPQFWTADSQANAAEFRPWSWLRKRAARERHEARLADIRDIDWRNTDVFDFFGLTEASKSRLSQRAIGALSSAISSEQRLAIHDFILNGMRVLLPDAAAKLASDYAENAQTREVAIRAIAFDLARWFREQLVAGQDVYVDIPHLIARAPWLLGEGALGDLAAWNAAANDVDMLLSISPWLNEYLVKKSYWGDRPCFDWPGIQADDRFNESSAILAGRDIPNFVFLEDASTFAPEEDAEGFLADFGNLWDRRYIRARREEPELTYGPLIRLAL